MTRSAERRSLSEATYALSADTGRFEAQAKLLCRSLRHNCPQAQIVLFVPEDSWPEFSADSRRFFERCATVTTGEIPLPEYPLSALHEAFVRAAERAEYDHVVMLDTDTVVASPLTVPDVDAELFVKPVDIGASYWGTDESYADWRRLYDHFEVSFPTTRVESTVDGCPTLPYWNGGVVATTDTDLPAEWLAMTEEVMESDFLRFDETFFFEQLSLAVLAQERETVALTERQNYPLQARVACPRDVEVIHYHALSNLARIPDPWLRSELSGYGADMGVDPVEAGRRLLHVGRSQSGRVLSPAQREALREGLVRAGKLAFE